MTKNKIDEMKKLIGALDAAAGAYYRDNREIMPDREYDGLYDRLLKLENETGTILSNSPTQKVGFDVVGELLKVEHEIPLLSLDKTKQTDDLKEFLGGRAGLLSWKLDGLTVILKYQNGALHQAITRGNGQIGEDITHNAKFFKNIPLKIPYTGDVTLRGEAVISYPDFESLNNELALLGKETYKNPRNLCSGTVRQQNSEVSAGRNVCYFVFGVVKTDMDFNDKKSMALDWLTRLGFECVETVSVTADTVENAVKSFADRIDKNIFGSDGLVLTYDSISYSASLGATSKFPKDSIAFKWKDELKETRLLSVEWNTSRTGLINPVAVFEPVELEGTVVTRASLHNISIIEGLALGIDDAVLVYKANMIIPQVADNLTRTGSVAPPDKCPVCGSAAVVRELNDSKFLYCENPACKAQLQNALAHFVSRDGLNIEGLSEETIKKFMEKGFLNNYTDIFKLGRFKDDIINMEGFGARSYENLTRSIEKAKTVKLHNFLYALGIAQVGLANAKLLCKRFPGGLSEIMSAPAEDLSAIEGFGGVISESVVRYFSNDENIALLNEAATFLTLENENVAKGTALEDKIFVITGDLTAFENRNALKDLIESKGGKVTSSVTSKTSFLINNNILSNSSKNKKAKELNIPIITEAEFLERYG